MLLDFVEAAVINDEINHITDVVGLIGIIGHYVVELFVGTQVVVTAGLEWRILHIIGGQIAHQLTDQKKAIFLRLGRQVGHPADGIMSHRAAQFFKRYVLTGHGFDDVGASDEHMAAVLDHENKIGEGRRIDRTPCTWPHDNADLRDDARGQGVAQKYIGVTGQAHNAFLDASATRVIDADYRRAVTHGHIHDLAYFLGMDAAQAAAKYGEVLAEDVDEAAVYRAPSGYNAVAEDLLFVHAEVGFAMNNQGVDFPE